MAKNRTGKKIIAGLVATTIVAGAGVASGMAIQNAYADPNTENNTQTEAPGVNYEELELQEQLAQIQQQLAETQTLLNNKTTAYNELKIDLENTSADLAQKTSDLSSAQEKVSVLTAENATLLEQYNTKVAELETAESDLATAQANVNTLTAEKADLENRLATETENKETLQAELDNVNTQLETANSELATAQETIQAKNSELEVLQSDYDAKVAELETAESDLATAQANVDTLTAEKADLEDRLAIETETKEALQTELDRVNSELETANSELATAQETIQTKNSELEVLQSNYDAKVAELETAQSEVTTLTEQVKSLQSEKAQLETDKETLITEKAELQQKIDNYEQYINTQVGDGQVFISFEFDGEFYMAQVIDKNGTASITDPESTNYVVFNYWTVNGERIDLSTCQFATNTKVIANVTHKYNVKFMVGTNVHNSQFIEEGKTASLPSNPTKTGYVFNGWSLNGTDIVSNIETTSVTKDVTYIAVFTALSQAVFTVSTDNEWEQISADYYSEGSSVTTPENPTKDGFIFLGWVDYDAFNADYITQSIIDEYIIDFDSYQIGSNSVMFMALFLEDYNGTFVIGEGDYDSFDLVIQDNKLISFGNSNFTWDINENDKTESEDYFAYYEKETVVDPYGDEVSLYLGLYAELGSDFYTFEIMWECEINGGSQSLARQE